MTARTEIKLAGFGGQGIILGAYVLGKAASLYGGRYATMTQSYGPESRGGACSANVVIMREPGLYPALTQLDTFAVLSQEAADTYAPMVHRTTHVYFERDMVKWKHRAGSTGLPAIAMAESLGNKLSANMVMVGALVHFLEPLDQGISPATIEEAIKSTVKKSFVEVNLKAFRQGYEWQEPEDESEMLMDIIRKVGSPG